MNACSSTNRAGRGAPARNRLYAGLLIALASFATADPLYAQAGVEPPPQSYNIPSGRLGDALNQLASQSKLQIIYSPELVKGKKAKALSGEHKWRDALQLLLAGSGLEWGFVNDTTVVIRAKGNAHPSPAPAPAPSKAASKAASEQLTVLPAVLVKGGTSLNTDVLRTEDDIQPYVVFDRQEIAQSQASNVEEFLRARLPMATDRGTSSRNDPVGNYSGNRSSINLRGLGTNQTLILVDGRRAPGVLTDAGSDFAQPDVNGIPIASIDRIEILPGTASGIHGGGATGGVINIILRKDYSGAEVRLTYDNSFDTDSARRRIDVNSGFALESGRTRIMLSGSYADGNDLLAIDRDFIGPARQRAYENAPEWFLRNADLSATQPNFRNALGDDLTLLDGTPYGSSFGSVPVGYVGGDGGAGLLAGAGVLDFAVPAGVGGQQASLSAVPENQALNLTIRREMTEAIDAYLDLSATNSTSVTRRNYRAPQILLEPGQAGNPFQDYVFVTLPPPNLDTETTTESSTQRVNGGVIVDLSHDWTAGLDLNWNRAANSYDLINNNIEPGAFAAAVAAGEVDLFRDLNQFPIDYSPFLLPDPYGLPSSPSYTKDYSARIAGPLFSLPAGQVRMTGLVSLRNDQSPGLLRGSAALGYTYYHPRSQVSNSVYVETLIPLVSEAQDVFLVHALEAQFSTRWDRYRTTTSPYVQYFEGEPRPEPDEATNTLTSTDYTAGLKFMPFSDLSIRASYSTGFLPPSLTQLLGFSYEDFMRYRDPRRGNTRSRNPMTLIGGGNIDAKPEQSTSKSVGLIYTPSFAKGLRISVDYLRIDKTDELVYLNPVEILQYEALFPDRVVRGGHLPGDPADWAGVVTSLDTSILNASRSRVEATDFQVDYERDIGGLGWLRVYAVGTVQSTMGRQVASTSEEVNRVGFSDGPGRLRFNVGVNWERGPWSLALNTQHYDKYKVFQSVASAADQATGAQIQGSPTIPSQTYTDISGRYVYETGWLEGTEISFGIRNLFNKRPPLVATGDLSGGYSTFGDPRLRTYSVSIRKSF